MKKLFCALVLSVFATEATSQITSTNGTFIAAGTTNLGLLTNTTPRLTIIGSGTNIGRVWVGTGTPSPADLVLCEVPNSTSRVAYSTPLVPPIFL